MKGLALTELNTLPKMIEVDVPHDGMEEVEMHAAAMNRRDYYITKGLYPRIQLRRILGSDGCGSLNGQDVIFNPNVEWGDNERFQSSDYSVLGMPTHGTFADTLYIHAHRIFKKPEHLTRVEAAALPLAGLTAYRAAIVKGKISRNDTVLISGIGGGVALMAMQIAVAMGARVFVTSSSTKKIKKAQKLGAEAGVLYTEKQWAKKLQEMTGGVDVIIDSAGGDGFQHFIPLCKAGGRIAIYGGTRGEISSLNTQILFWRQLTIHGSTMGSDSDFASMIEFVTKHRITPVVDSIFPWTDSDKAFKKMENGIQFGKIVLEIST